MSAVDDARKRRQEAQGGSEGALTLAEISELVGDDIAFWLDNPFMDRSLIGGKVAWWVNRAIEARLAAHAPAQASGSVPVAPVPDEGAEGPEIGAERLAEWRRLADEATDGPWRWDSWRDDLHHLVGRGGSPDTYEYDLEVIEPEHSGECGCRSACYLTNEVREADRAFIAAARTAVPALLDEVERLRRWKAEALPVMAGLQELGKVLGLPLGTQITGPQAVEAVERLRRGARTLGSTIEGHWQMILDITGLHGRIDEDGDGDWGAVWENAYALRPRAEAAEAQLAAVAELVDDGWHSLFCASHYDGAECDCPMAALLALLAPEAEGGES